jgi:hypothetical protein
VNEYDVRSIADDLRRQVWVPSLREVSLGRALLHRCERIERESPPPGMPSLPQGAPPWLTQILAGQAALTRELETELLPVWHRMLPGSPMLALVEAYLHALRPVVPFADRMVNAWSSGPPPRPPAATVVSRAGALRITRPEAERELTRLAVQCWENQQLTGPELRSVHRCHQRAERVGLVLSSAVRQRL